MKQLLSIFLLLLPCTAAFAQQKPARSYYEEARQAGALPTLPYVCFRSAEETSQNPGVEAPYTDSTFAMLATSQQIGETIKSKTNSHMNDADQRTLVEIRGHDFLYIVGFDHGVNGGGRFFVRKDPNDPSKADWAFEGTTGTQHKPLTWDFNINWGTLRFRETLTIGSDSITYYGQCELVGK
jgi:hypothetical protein